MNIGIYIPRIGFSESGGTEALFRNIIPHLTDEHDVTLYTGAREMLQEVLRMDVNLRPIPLVAKESPINRALIRTSPLLPAEIESLTMAVNAYRMNVFEEMNREMDVVSTHYYLDNLLVSRLTETPTLFHFPGIKHPSIRWKLMARFADTDMYVSNSNSTASRAEKWLGIESAGVVYPGIDMEQFSPETEPAFDEEKFVVLFVGRLDTGKGVTDLIDAHAKLPADVALYIVGDGTERERFEEHAQKHGRTEDVTFVGAIPHEEIHRYYAASDVFCLPSYHEGFIGLVNMEAMACGVPVVSTTIDAIEEEITDEENGLLVEPGDVDAIANAIQRLYDSPALREKLRENATETVAKFSWEAQADRLIELFEELILTDKST